MYVAAACTAAVYVTIQQYRGCCGPAIVDCCAFQLRPCVWCTLHIRMKERNHFMNTLTLRA